MGAPEAIYSISSCLFRRTEESDWEPGLALNGGSLGIIDRYGRPADKCWDVKETGELKLEVGHAFGER